ncbi:hypothetical protein HYV80_03220 [Candidatus Woesearchaeota archaeon]|nr:hypothetical protein [Candidatus Woesearchaeota archaeon]
MSLLSKVTAPFRFVENEFEALVHSLHFVYHRRTGRDQYTLSNSYFDGTIIFGGIPLLANKGFTFESIEGLLLIGGSAGVNHYFNHKAKKFDQHTNDFVERVKNTSREDIRRYSKGLGRLGLFFVFDKLIYSVSGYSVSYLLNDISPNSLEDFFRFHNVLLYALSGYTSAMDLGNPKKSKILAGLKNLYSHARNFTQIPNPLPERAENKLSIQQLSLHSIYSPLS